MRHNIVVGRSLNNLRHNTEVIMSKSLNNLRCGSEVIVLILGRALPGTVIGEESPRTRGCRRRLIIPTMCSAEARGGAVRYEGSEGAATYERIGRYI